VVGLSSSWATQQVMGEQLRAMTRQIEELANDLRQMRQDLYAPRYKSSALVEAQRGRLPPGRP
jgi:ribosomal protein S15P/S13E